MYRGFSVKSVVELTPSLFFLHACMSSSNVIVSLLVLGDLKLVEKPQPIMLGPNDFSNIKVRIQNLQRDTTSPFRRV